MTITARLTDDQAIVVAMLMDNTADCCDSPELARRCRQVSKKIWDKDPEGSRDRKRSLDKLQRRGRC